MHVGTRILIAYLFLIVLTSAFSWIHRFTICHAHSSPGLYTTTTRYTAHRPQIFGKNPCWLRGYRWHSWRARMHIAFLLLNFLTSASSSIHWGTICHALSSQGLCTSTTCCTACRPLSIGKIPCWLRGYRWHSWHDRRQAVRFCDAERILHLLPLSFWKRHAYLWFTTDTDHD